MPKKAWKNHKTLEDFLDELKKQNSKDLDESYKEHEEFIKDENQDHFFNNLFTPAHDEFYTTASKSLKSELGDDDTKLHGKEKEIKKALAKGLLAYFDKVHPGLKDHMKKLDIDNLEDQFDYLASYYDQHIGTEQPYMTILPTALAKDKKATVGGLKRQFKSKQAVDMENALNVLQSKHYTHHFAKYHPAELGGYLKPKLEKSNVDIDDNVRFGTLDMGSLNELYNYLKTGKLPKDKSLKMYGLKKKKEESR